MIAIEFRKFYWIGCDCIESQSAVQPVATGKAFQDSFGNVEKLMTELSSFEKWNFLNTVNKAFQVLSRPWKVQQLLMNYPRELERTYQANSSQFPHTRSPGVRFLAGFSIFVQISHFWHLLAAMDPSFDCWTWTGQKYLFTPGATGFFRAQRWHFVPHLVSALSLKLAHFLSQFR